MGEVTNGGAATRWDIVVNNAWKEIRGNQEQILSMEKFGGHKTEVKEKIERRERLSLKGRWKGKNI